MKTQKFIFTVLFIFSTLSLFAQPQKSTLEIGGSGYWMKIRNDEGPQLAIYDFNAQASYFLLRNLAIGGNLSFRGGKDYASPFNPTYHRLYFAPVFEGYLLNHHYYGISIKTMLNIRISNTNKNLDKTISTFMIGPKFQWNITENLGTNIWFVYRDMNDLDNLSGYRTIAPSTNFDIRWGFSYFLHPKNE